MYPSDNGGVILFTFLTKDPVAIRLTWGNPETTKTNGDEKGTVLFGVCAGIG